MTKKTAICIVLIAFISVACITYFFLNNLQNQNNTLKAQLSELQNQVDELKEQNSYLQNVRITFFSLSGYNNYVGLIWNYGFIVRIQNNLTIPASGLTLTFNVISNYTIDRKISIFDPLQGYTAWERDLKVGESYDLGIFSQGETKEVRGEIWNNPDDVSKLRGSSFVATLRLNGAFLDERTIHI